MWFKRFSLVFVLGVLLAAFLGATHYALAISNIENNLRISPRVFTENMQVNFETSSTYGWSWEPNPYTSNYQINIRYWSFSRPTLWSTNLPVDNEHVWEYMDLDEELDVASWRIQWGTWFVMPTQERYYDFFSYSGDVWDTGINSHGNYDCGITGWNSCGPAAKVQTFLVPRNSGGVGPIDW